MVNILWHIHQSIVHKTPITITVKSQYVSFAEYHCVIFEWLDGDEKIRFHLMDKSFNLLYDDMTLPQISTIQVKNIMSIQPIHSLNYNYPSELILKSKIALEKQSAKDYFDVYQASMRALFKQESIEKIESPLEKVSIDPLKVLYKSLLVINKETVFQPLLSCKLVYDIEQHKYIESSLHLHTHHKNVFKYIPTDIENMTVKDIKNIIKPHINFKESKQFFKIQTKIPKSVEDRINLVLKEPQNRPFKAYFDLLTLKNLGRKDYILPFKKEKLSLLEYQIAFSSMKHPVTLFYDASEKEIQNTALHIMHTALLNQQSILIVDKHQLIDKRALPIGVLDLREDQDIMKPFSQVFKSHEQLDTYQAMDYEMYFNHIEASLKRSGDYHLLEGYIEHFNSYKLFHESIMAESFLIEMNRHHYETPIKDLFNKLTTQSMIDKHLETMQAARIKKLKHKAYKKLYDIVKVDDFKTFVKEIKKPFIFQQIKQIFPAIIVKNTTFLAYQKKPFDCTVFINPNQKNSLDLHYSDKITILSDAAHKHMGLTDVYLSVKEDVVKVYQGSASYPSLTIHPVVSKKETEPHVSTKESVALKQFTNYYPIPNLDVRTAFNQQKKYLKSILKQPVKTLYDPLNNNVTLVSLGIHKETTQETYDWLKNQPHMMPKLYDNHTHPIHLFIDVEKVVGLSDGTDLLFNRLLNETQKQVNNLDSVTFDHLILKYDINFYKSNVEMKSILLGLPHMESLSEAAFVLYNQVNEVKMILLRKPVHPSNYTIDRLLKRTRQEKIDVFFLDTPTYQIFTKKIEILKQLRRLNEIW